MHEAWAGGLTAIGDAVPPPRDASLRAITQASVDSDGVSEAGLPAERVQQLIAGFADVESTRACPTCGSSATSVCRAMAASIS